MSDATEKQRRMANLMAVALWSELKQKAGPSVLAAKLPKDAADVLRDLMLDALRQADLADALAAALEEIASYDTGATAGLAYTAKAALAAYEGRK